MNNPKGIIVFTTVGRPYYGFDIFSVKLPLNFDHQWSSEHRLTDGVSVNFNGQFVDEDETSIVYISERTGSPRIYFNHHPKTEQLPSVSESLFHDRPIVKNAHEKSNQLFRSWSAVYSTGLDDRKTVRLTPYEAVDYSPAVSQTGKFIAVASYGNRPWKGEFQELDTDIVVFRDSDPNRRTVVCKNGGWPTWSGDSTIFFHRKADDGWWSIFRIDLPEAFIESAIKPHRITPPGVHAFTPTASHNKKLIAVATRRREMNFRHIELFNLETESFHKVTESLNSNFHHYNPFFSPESGFLGYHRFRGEESTVEGDSTIPHLEPVVSPVKELKMYRLNGSFPSFSPDGDLIALNHNFNTNPGVGIISSNGSRSWILLKDRVAFCVSWSKTEKGVIYSSVGPIFQSPKTTVQIARISFDPTDLDDRNEILGKVTILTREDTGNNAFPSCSPDGKHLVFRSGRSGFKNLYIVDAVNGEVNGEIRQLTEGPWIDTMPNWSPDGKLIAFSSNRHNPDNSETFSIYLIRPDGTELRRVYVAGVEGSSDVDNERINHVCFSPDSKWLLFTANLGGVTSEPVSLPNQFQPYGDLYMAKLDGSELKRLTCNGYENGTPTWQSDVEVDIDIDIGSLSLVENKATTTMGGEKLRGQFDEPLWITCDI